MKKYNGWTNRETWVFHLHLNNEYELCKLVESWKILPIKNIKKNLKLLIIKFYFESESNHILKDVGDLSKINFQEIAEAIRQS